MPIQQEPRKPGLKAVYEGREQRVKGKFTRLTPRILLFLVSSFFLIILLYGFFAKRSLDKAKGELLAKRRAVEATLGPEWFPLRDNLEKLTLDTANNWPGDWVDSIASKTDFRSAPTVYLRLRVADAKNVESLRAHAKDSVKDAFAGCMFKGAFAPSPDGGTETITRDNAMEIASRGLADVWNLREAYASTRVLTDQWADEVKDASDDLRLRVFEQQFDLATRKEIPLAVKIIKRAQWFVLVLDEDAPEALDKSDGGAITMEALQLVPHTARVRIWNLRTNAELARVKATAGGGVRFVGEQATSDPEAMEAAQRQVNNCALANRVQAALGLGTTK